MDKNLIVDYIIIKKLLSKQNISSNREILNFINNLKKIIKDENLKEKLIFNIKLFSVNNCVFINNDMIGISVKDCDNLTFFIAIENSSFEYGNTKVSYKFEIDGKNYISENGIYELYEDGSYSISYDKEEQKKSKDLIKEKTEKSEVYDSNGNQVFDELYKYQTDWIAEKKREIEYKEITFKNEKSALKRIETSICYNQGNISKKYNNIKYLEANNLKCSKIYEIDEKEYTEISFNKYKKKLYNYSTEKAKIRQKY